MAAATAKSRPVPMAAPALSARERRHVLVATSTGTVFEWYDFYLFLVLAPVLSQHFLSALPAARADVFVVLLFVVGFLTRPLGALLFGSLGDRWGRKTPFVITLVMMSLSTANVAWLPTQDQWGLAAPVALLLQRAVQGLALGGEYGGAVTFVAESAPPGRRGLHTAWLQTTASIGLLLAMAVVATLRVALGEAAFVEWGWRVPYGLSAAMLLGSLWVRWRLVESPVFEGLVAQGRTLGSPLNLLLGTPFGRRRLLLAVFGLCAGQAVIWYSAHVSTLVFLQGPLTQAPAAALATMAAVIATCLPLVVLAGWLSDRVGRRPVLLAGLALGAACMAPAFQGLEQLLRPGHTGVVVQVEADPRHCSRGLGLYATGAQSPCDELRRLLIERGVAHERVPAAGNHASSVVVLRVGEQRLQHPSADGPLPKQLDALLVASRVIEPGPGPEPGSPRWWGVMALLVLLGGCAAAVYGPLAAALAELFPSAIRYSGTSLAYHLGNGVFGGLMPVIAALSIALTGHPLAGLAYPVLVAALACLVAWRWLPEGRDVEIRH